MNTTHTKEPLQLPISLEEQLLGFRRRVWTVKMAEATGVAVFALAGAFLCVFVMDRLWDTPRWLRLGVFLTALLSCAIVPLFIYYWIWCQRQLDQLARLLVAKLPHLGDELLGVVELVHSASEQARSRALCEAAIDQVAHTARKKDLRDAVPDSRYRLFGVLAGLAILVSVCLAVFSPSAAANAWARLLAPLSYTPRYTFAAVEPLPTEIVVPHGEPFSFTACLAEGSRWHPAHGQVQIGEQQAVSASLEDGSYKFVVPAQIADSRLYVSIGDSRQSVKLKPMLRPELTAIVADVALPEYLGHPDPLKKDVRGGSVSLVKGSRAVFVATASRPLSTALVNDLPRAPESASISSPKTLIDKPREIEFQWEDEFGLAGKEPFTLRVAALEDEPPTLSCEDLPRSKVVLDSEQLLFRVMAYDDYGVKRVGMEWQNANSIDAEAAAKGEKFLAAGGHEKPIVDARATFSAQSLGIEPQPIHLRIFAEDYFPGRKRVYSPTYVLYVLSAEQHAIWMTELLSKWHRHSLEVRDREMQLHETNKQLRDMSPQQLDRPETRRRIEKQAMAERSNRRKLSNLVTTGEELVRQAVRNPEFGVGHLERWAEMLQILKDIAANRMPSVADLLQQASQAKQTTAGKPSKSGPKAGQVRATGSGGPAKSPPDKKDKIPAVPQIVDMESSQQPPGDEAKKPNDNKSSCKPSLRLPTTTLLGGGPKKDEAKKDAPSPAGEKVDEAVRQQQDLLTEFEKIVNELNNILADLEGSTLVKRLKAASRKQYRVAGRIGNQLEGSFGSRVSWTDDSLKKVFTELADIEDKSSQNISLIMDDMQAYYERRRFVKFNVILEEMKKEDVVGGLRQLGDDISGEPGLSIAQCEYWSDAMDRWAEDLVDPACSGMCPGSKSRASLPPSIVLEVLHILEGEVNLREETRVVEQAQAAVAKEEYGKQAFKLSKTQDSLEDRVVKVVQRIGKLPDAEKEFACETKLLNMVAQVMNETTKILARPETGTPAIGAETEIIELLLQSRRINPGGGGGGGSTPGGGGTGTTSDSALALLGIGVNKKENRDDPHAQQSLGGSGRSLPEEFRTGLDEYFNRLEQPQGR